MASKVDVVGEWTERKLQILDAYLKQYWTIMNAPGQARRFRCHYVDAFANVGRVIPRRDPSIELPGSARLAMAYPFAQFWLVEQDHDRAEELRGLRKDYPGLDIEVKEGDTNVILPNEVLPAIRWDRLDRGFVFLDPYKLNVLAATVDQLAANKAIECLINFPIMDTNRNVLPRETTADALNAFMAAIGDTDIIENLYSVQLALMGDDQLVRDRVDPARLASLYRSWLLKHGFTQVSDPLVILNTIGAPLYALIYAGHNKTGVRIVNWILSHTNQPWVRRPNEPASQPHQPGLFDEPEPA